MLTRRTAERLAILLEKARVADDPEVQVMALDALAALRAAADDVGEARELLERADALMPSAGHRIAATDRLDADRARSLLEPAATSAPG
jgi:hypothetical protein